MKNGMLGAIRGCRAGRHTSSARWQSGAGGPAQGHGNAGNLPGPRPRLRHHDPQDAGATVDRAFVLASETMDRHLTYVAMTRHRDGVQLYGSQAEFAGRNAGRLIEHGRAPYNNDPRNGASYFVTLEGDGGQRRTLWGVGLERALAEARPSIGDLIVLEAAGSETVRLPGGGTGERQERKVSSARDAAWRQLESRLSRSGLKETTLDYALDFAERRGIAETLGVRSEIEIRASQASTAGPAQAAAGADHPARAPKPHPRAFRRSAAMGGGSGPHAGPQAGAKPRRGMFDGLKLNAGRVAAQGQDAAPRRPAAEDSLGATGRDLSRARSLSPFEQAVDRHARALGEVDKFYRKGLPIPEAQSRELDAARQGLDQARPGTLALCDPPGRMTTVVRALSDLSGQERIDQIVAGLDRERAALADPNVRAERFVDRWQELQGERDKLGWQEHAERERIEGEMRSLSSRLDGDPQLEAVLRDRGEALGIGEAERSRAVFPDALRQSLAPRSPRFGPGM